MIVGPIVDINLCETIRFFDEKPDWGVGHATGVVAILGEDLAAAALKHCLESNGATMVAIRNETVGTGKKRGPRLDRWIEADLSDGRKVLFQTEIKNFSAWAIGGKTLSFGASRRELTAYQNDRWQDRWDAANHTLSREYTAKVLVRMKPPAGVGEREQLPLLIFWEPIAPKRSFKLGYKSDGGHLFSVPDPTCDFGFSVPSTWDGHERGFTELWIFSASSYLRGVAKTQDNLGLEMPIAAHRIGALNRLFDPGVGRPAP